MKRHFKSSSYCIVLFVCAICTATCTTTQKRRKVSKPVSVRKIETTQKPSSVCTDGSPVVTQPTPFYVPEHKTFITAFTNHCNDTPFVERSTDWAAMRLPCTEGTGEYDLKGHSSNPKHVGFDFNLNCAFLPRDKALFEKDVNSTLGLIPSASSLAINPMSVQYWVVEGTQDADIGHDVKLRTYAGLAKFDELRKGEPLKVHLYGRENAWGSEQNFYHFEVQIKLLAGRNFMIEVLNAEALDSQMREDIGEHCRSLSPKRSCHLIF